MKAEEEKFCEFIERGLSFERSCGSGGRKALCDKEAIAWELRDSGGPAGSILLGDDLIRKRISFLRGDLDAVAFARSLVAEGFPALTAKEEKNLWDWYYLGICHEFGRGTPVSHGQAAECFRKAKQAGNPYAEYEEIWSAYLSGTPALETIFRLRECSPSSRLYDFAQRVAHALAVLEMGPVREVGSGQHVCRILEISRLLGRDYYHEAGSRHINVRVQKEMSLDVAALKSICSPPAALVLFLIARNSPANPTRDDPEVWLNRAIHPDNGMLLPVIRTYHLTETQLNLVKRVCEDNHWEQSEIYQFAVQILKQCNEDDNEDPS